MEYLTESTKPDIIIGNESWLHKDNRLRCFHLVIFMWVFCDVLPEAIACACASGTFCTTSIVVPLCMTDRATGNDVSPSGFPWVCACATTSCAISALVGPFDWK